MNVTPVAGSIFGSLSQSYPPLEQVHSARLSCTADARPLTGFEKGPNLAENRVQCLADNLRWKFHLFLSEPARPSSPKLPLNGFTEWNFLSKKETAYQNREFVWRGLLHF